MKFEDLQQLIADHQRDLDRTEAAHDLAMEKLAREFDCENLNQAVLLRAELDEKIKNAKEQFLNGLEQFDDNYGEDLETES